MLSQLRSYLVVHSKVTYLIGINNLCNTLQNFFNWIGSGPTLIQYEDKFAENFNLPFEEFNFDFLFRFQFF